MGNGKFLVLEFILGCLLIVSSFTAGMVIRLGDECDCGAVSYINKNEIKHIVDEYLDEYGIVGDAEVFGYFDEYGNAVEIPGIVIK